jgi:hypothetical protein
MRLPVIALLSLGVVTAGAARPARADADSLVDNLGASETGVGEAKRAAAIGALATRLNPAGLPLSTELVFDGGFSYRPDDHASIIALAACDSTNAMPGCFYYTHVGSDDPMQPDMHAHVGGFTLSRALSHHVIVGGGAKYYNVHENGMKEASGFNWDIGTTVRLTDMLNVAGVGYNLWGKKSAQFPRAAAAGVMLRPIGKLSASFDAVWNLDHADGTKTGRYGGGLEYFATSGKATVGYPIRVGALHDVADGGTHLTAGLGFATMKMGIDLAARKEVSGGDELAITAAIRIYGPRQAM